MSRIRAFLLSFCLTAGVLVPLIGCILLLQSKQMQKEQEQQAQQAGVSASGVPIALPTPDDRFCCFVVLQQGEENHYLLLELNAVKNQISALGFPGETVVLSTQGGATTLDEAYKSAGPGRAAEQLAETLHIEIPHYLSGKAEQIAKAATNFGSVTVNLSGYSIPGAKASVGKAPLCMMVPEQVFPLLEEWNLDNAAQSNLLANITGEFLLSAIQTDSTQIGQLLRQCSSNLLTTLTSTEFLQIDHICKLMSSGEPEFVPQILPGKMVSGKFELNETTLGMAAQLFQPSPSTIPSPSPSMIPEQSSPIDSSSETESSQP